MMTNDIEWKMVKLGDVTQVFSGGTPSTDHLEYWNGNIPWMNSGELNLKIVNAVEGRITELGLKSSSTHWIPKECVLIGLAGQGKTRGTAAFNTIPLCTNQSIAAIYPNESFFDSKYLYFYFDTQYEKLRELSSGGGGRGGLNKNHLLQYMVPIPYKNGAPDLETQKQIAQKLGDMDSLIAAKEKLLAKKRNLKVAAMQKLIKDEEGENWKKVKLGDVAEFLPTNTLSRDELNYSEGEYLNIHYGDVLIKFESVTDVLNSEIPYVSLDKKFSDKSLLKNGDIVMADTAEDESVGKVTEIQNIGNCKVVSGLHTLCIRFQENLFAPKFAGYYLNSPAFHNLLLPYMHGTKVTSISKGDVKKINFPIPYKNSAPDLTEQRRIASILSDVDSEIAAIEKEITKLQKLKTAMMQKMFCFEDSDSSSE